MSEQEEVIAAEFPETSSHLLDGLEYCVIDLETTGGNLKTDRIIEIGMIHIHGLKLGLTKNWLINPEKKIPDFIQKLTNISQDDVKDAPKIQDIIDEIRSFIGDKILVAHNITFDIPFLGAVFKKYKQSPIKNKVLCTNVMSKYLVPGIMNSNLPYLCDLFRLKHERAHQALSDAKATAELLIIYLKNFRKRNLRKVNQLYYPKNKYELDRINYSFNPNIKELIEQISQKCKSITTTLYITFKGETGEILLSSIFKNGQHFEELKTEWAKFVSKAQSFTIRLYGQDFEAMIHLRETFLKCSTPVKSKILKSLELTHPVSEFKMATAQLVQSWNKEIANFYQQWLVQNFCFIAIRHLVHDQIIILTPPHFSLRQAQVFKLPSQKRKVQQYIAQLQKRDFFSTRISSSSVQSIDFLVHWMSYLLKLKKSNESLVFNFSDLSISAEELENQISKFLDKNKNIYQYPFVHL